MTGGSSPDLPRVVVAITYGLAVRYALNTGLLARLARHCTPVLVLGWDDPALAAELDRLGLEVHRLPQARIDHPFRMLLQRLAIVHEQRLRSPTTRMRRARWNGTYPLRVQAVVHARRVADRAALLRPGEAARLEQEEAERVGEETNVAEFEALLDAVDANAVVSLMPYHDQDALLLWAGRRLGLPRVASVISFDNPTIRGRLPSLPDLLLVWNADNADQVLRSHPELRPDQVRVIGAPQFDLHRRPDLVMADAEWRDRLGLPPDRPIILYGAGPTKLVGDEAAMVELLDRAITGGRLPGRPFLLVRRHPVDPPGTWAGVSDRLANGVVVDAWAPNSDAGRGWPTDDDLALQMSSLAHAAVHVNVSSSMSLDGAMFDRPQVCPTFLPGADARVRKVIGAFVRQEHWLPVARSGGVAQVGDEASLLAAVADGLQHPEHGRAGRRRMIEAVLTSDDGRSGDRWIDEVVGFLDSRSVERGAAEAPRYAGSMTSSSIVAAIDDYLEVLDDITDGERRGYFAALYERRHGAMETAVRNIEFGFAHFGPGLIADIGCGDGLQAYVFTKHGRQVMGVDVAEDRIEVARAAAAKLGVDIEYLIGDATESVQGRTLGAVWMHRSVGHIHLPDFFAAAHAALEPDGSIVLSTSNSKSRALVPGVRRGQYDVATMQQHLEGAGFRIVEQYYHGYLTGLPPKYLPKKVEQYDRFLSKVPGLRAMGGSFSVAAHA